MNIKNLLNKSVVDVIVKKELEEKLKAGKKLKVKFGIDPSGSYLTLGHMVPVRKLGEFQKDGHEINLIFGNFTAQIGDPSGKSKVRNALTQEEVEKNAENYIAQVSKFLDVKKIKVFWNNDWLDKLRFSDVVKLAQTFTVQQMMERDMYQERAKKDQAIYMHEFLYPLMQGYDSVQLKSDLEIGGTDQTFNLLAGRTIQKAYGIEPQHILTVPLLVGTDGHEKMGKSLNNYIGVMESPKEMFGKTMSIPDEVILHYFELTTDLSINEIEKIKKLLKEGENPRNLKIKLAKEIVSIYYSKKEADQEEEEFIQIFSNKQNPTDIEKVNLNKEKLGIIELVKNSGFSGSNGEIRRLVQGGGVKIDGEKIDDIDKEIDLKTEKLLQVGKRYFKNVVK